MTDIVEDPPGDALHPTDAELALRLGAVIAYGLVRLFYPHDHSETNP